MTTNSAHSLLPSSDRNLSTGSHSPEDSSESYGHPVEALHTESSLPDRVYVIIIMGLRSLIKRVPGFTILPLMSSTRALMLHHQPMSIILVENMSSMKSGPGTSVAAPKRYTTTARKAYNGSSFLLLFHRIIAMA
jgi:hypothetical protein